MSNTFPGAAQTSYSIYTNPAQAGTLLWGQDGINATILTYVSASDTIPFGVGLVADVSSGDSNCKLPSSSGDVFIGLALIDAAQEALNVDTNGTGVITAAFLPTYPIPVLSADNGAWVNVDGNVAPGQPVYCRYAGRQQVQTVVFSANLITANVINGSVNGVALAPTTFATDNATTLAAIATLIAAQPGILSAVSDGVHTITVTTSVNGALTALTGFVVTLGASQATVAITQTIVPVPNSSKGYFRADSDSSTALQVKGARWMQTVLASQLAPSIAPLQVMLPVSSGF